jgi:pimeloyl-ACP methyl ester carboxylesterase
MKSEAMVMPGKAIVVGQSGGGWGAIALSSLNPSSVRAIITFAAGRGERVDGKRNNNCASDKLVDATREFGRASRIPMLWIYSKNDTYFGPDEADARGIHTGGGQCGISHAASLRLGRTLPDWFTRRRPNMVAFGKPVP